MPHIPSNHLDKANVYSRLVRFQLAFHPPLVAASKATAAYYKMFGELPYRFERPRTLDFASNMTPQLLAELKNLTPEQAVAYMRAKQLQVTHSHRDMDAKAHQRAFTVAKVTSAQALQDIRNQLAKALESGQSFADWKKDMTEKLGNRQAGLTPARLETVFRNNVQSAMMAGRKAQMDTTKADFPYRQYLAIDDESTTDMCHDLNGKVFPADDPFWDKYTPPNHHKCRASVRSLSQVQLAREGLEVESGKDYEHAAAMAKDQGFDAAPTLDSAVVDTSGLNPDIKDVVDKALAERPPLTEPPPATKWDKKTLEKERDDLRDKRTRMPMTLNEANESVQHFGNMRPAEVLEYVTCEGAEYTSPSGDRFELMRSRGLITATNGKNATTVMQVFTTKSNVAGRRPEVELTRQFGLDANGNRYVYHDLMQIDEELQRSGIAKDIWRNSLAAYDRMGVKEIKVCAALDGGHHTWGKFGFDFANDSDRVRWRQDFSEHMKASGIDADEADRYVSQLHEPRDFQRKHVVANVEVDGDKWKREVMTRPWQGKLDLSDKTSTGYKTLMRYLNKD